MTIQDESSSPAEAPSVDSYAVSSIELGRRISQLRDQANIKQAQLARSITWSPAVMSRVEAGDRPVSPEELDSILEAIGTPDALRLSEILHREWAFLDRPDL